MNQVSHFLDGSTIYGSTMKKSREIRTFEGGRLRVDIRNNHAYLPRGDAELILQCGENCYNSGENLNPTHLSIYITMHLYVCHKMFFNILINAFIR